MAIVSFQDRRLAAIFRREPVGKGFPADLTEAVGRKLRLLNAAEALNELKAPKGNRLEPSRGNLTGFWSIRVSDQYRIIFRWTEAGPVDLAFVESP